MAALPLVRANATGEAECREQGAVSQAAAGSASLRGMAVAQKPDTLLSGKRRDAKPGGEESRISSENEGKVARLGNAENAGRAENKENALQAENAENAGETREKEMSFDTEEIRLNEAFRKAIESGRFLPAEPGSLSLPSGGREEGGFRLPAGPTDAVGRPLGRLGGASGRLPLAADFSEYIGPDPFLEDTLRRLTDSAGLTPQLFMLQHFKPKLARSVRKGAYTPVFGPEPDKGMRLGKLPVYVKVSAGNLFLDEVRDGQRRGSINVTVLIIFSAEDVLEKIFWKSARYKARNRKRENTWKYYNDMP